jgi:hypothetical protein
VHVPHFAAASGGDRLPSGREGRRAGLGGGGGRMDCGRDAGVSYIVLCFFGTNEFNLNKSKAN